jgi:hypothetical protein
MSLREHQTPFSKPLFIHQQTKKHNSTHCMDKDNEDKNFGTDLITSKKKTPVSTVVIVSDYLEDKHTIKVSEFIRHARKLFPNGNGFKLIESTSFYFVQFINDNKRVLYTVY